MITRQRKHFNGEMRNYILCVWQRFAWNSRLKLLVLVGLLLVLLVLLKKT